MSLFILSYVKRNDIMPTSPYAAAGQKGTPDSKKKIKHRARVRVVLASRRNIEKEHHGTSCLERSHEGAVESTGWPQRIRSDARGAARLATTGYRAFDFLRVDRTNFTSKSTREFSAASQANRYIQPLHTNPPEKREAKRMPVAMSVQVPKMLTKNTHRPVATAFPLPVFFMRKAMNRSNAGARLTERAKRGTLTDQSTKSRNGSRSRNQSYTTVLAACTTVVRSERTTFERYFGAETIQ